jgi:hypothetical protein
MAMRRIAIAPPASMIKIVPTVRATAATTGGMLGVTAEKKTPPRLADSRRAVTIACMIRACMIRTAIAAIGPTATRASSFTVTETIRAAALRRSKRRDRGPSHSGAAPSDAAIRTTTSRLSPQSTPRAPALSLFCALFALDRQAARSKFDVHAFGLMAVAIELIAHHDDGGRQHANNKIKDVSAGHGGIPLDTIAFEEA